MKRTTQLVLLLILLVLATVLLVLLVLPGRYGVSPPAGTCCPDTIHVDATASALSSSAQQTKMALAVGGSTPGVSLTAGVPTEMLPSEGGGGGDGGGGGGRPTGTALPIAVVEPIRRRAELSYPKKVEVNRSTTVRFTIFAPNDPPESEPGNETPQVPMTITNVPGMQVRVSVILEVHGATQEDRTESEQDLTNYNLWEWAITPEESGDISMKPHVSVRYFDSNNGVAQAVTLDAQNPENLWTAQSVTIPASNVVSNVFFESMGSWFNANLLGVVAIVLGLPGTVISWRELAGKRRPAPSAAPG